ncbi:MAG TPA: N-acetylglucosamine-6-phosphate deacetylase, partial [Anaerolineae bacterium]|nr:N-acetylglucosamine-6-phosphate deacetylase [Anaerolineae bacterium]HIQ04878.1 N-acetylglucosamine-6-phosphate deacetylase [Anaerolineae bacterium]
MIVFDGGRLITPSEIIEEGILLVEHDRIRAVGPRDQVTVPAGVQRIEVSGRLVTPGFIDLHVHGGGGAQAIDGSPADVLRMAQFHAQHGTTSLLVTVAGSDAHLRAGIQAALEAQAIGAESQGATILGIHLEGP